MSRRWLPLLLVLLGHALLGLALLRQQQQQQTRPQAAPVQPRLLLSVRLLGGAAADPAAPARPATPARSARSARLAPAPPAQRSPAPPPVAPLAAEAAAPLRAAASAPVSASVSASAAAVAARPGESLLDSAATRQVLREAARGPLLAERLAQSSGMAAPLTPEQKLGQQIARSADGDCLKGEFAGAGMGLLSAPFWLLAEARGKCRR